MKKVSLKNKVKNHARSLMSLYKTHKPLDEYDKKYGTKFGNHHFLTQAYRDGLESMKQYDLIVDYHLDTGEITFNA